MLERSPVNEVQEVTSYIQVSHYSAMLGIQHFCLEIRQNIIITGIQRFVIALLFTVRRSRSGEPVEAWESDPCENLKS